MIARRANYSAETKAEELLSPEATAMSTMNHNPGDRFSLLIHVDKKRGVRESRTRRNRKSVNELVCNVLFFFLFALSTSFVTVTRGLSHPAAPRCTIN